MRILAPALLAIAATVAPAAGTAAGGNIPATSSLFASLLAGHQAYDAGRGLDDGPAGTFALGYRFSDRLSGELAGGRSETQFDGPGGGTVDVDTTRADALWHYLRSGRWQPYVSSGLGQWRLNSTGRETGETFAGFGIGVFRHLAGPFHFRGDARTTYGFDEEAWDARVTAGVTVVFGGNYLGTPATPAAR